MTVCAVQDVSLPTPSAPVVREAAPALWYVLHTRSRQEKALAQTLAAMRCEHFLPLVRQQRLWGRRKEIIEAPLFPGYLFLRGSREELYEADRTGRVAHIIDVTNQAQLEQELAAIRAALASELVVDPYPFLQQGVRVTVRSGPLRGVEGRVESRCSMERLILSVNVLGQACAVEIDAALLEPLA